MDSTGPEVAHLLDIVVAPENKSVWPAGSQSMAVAAVVAANPVSAVRPVVGDIRGSCNRGPGLPFRLEKSVKCYFNEVVRILLLRQRLGAEEDGKLWVVMAPQRLPFGKTQKRRKSFLAKWSCINLIELTSRKGCKRL